LSKARVYHDIKRDFCRPINNTIFNFPKRH
jgi:hypothetical protein